MKRRVVVTGLGVVSSIGIGKDEFWKNLIAGKSGISDITTFDTSDYSVHKGGEVKNFDSSKFIPKNRIKEIARASQFAIVAAKLAFDDVGLDVSDYKNKKVSYFQCILQKKKRLKISPEVFRLARINSWINFGPGR